MSHHVLSDTDHDPPDFIRTLTFEGDEPEELQDFLEAVLLILSGVIESFSLTEDGTQLTISITSFKNDPTLFDSHFLREMSSFTGVSCITTEEEDQCHNHT